MTFRLSSLRLLALAAIVLGAALPASAQRGTARSVADRLSRLSSTLSLSTSQQQRLDALAARYAEASPADSWRLAAEVSDVLTADQKQQLRAAAATRHADRASRSGDESRAGDRARRGERRDRGERGMRGRRGMPRGAADGARSGASDAQRTQMRDLMRTHADEQRALVERFRAGSLTAAAFTAERDRLRERHRAAVDALLTPEQRQARAAREAQREAAREARVQALGLTEGQRQALEALRLEHLRSAPARPEPQVGASQRGARPSDADRAAMHARREQMRAQAEQILTPAQRDLMLLHRALTSGHGPRGMRGDGARRGGRTDAVDR